MLPHGTALRQRKSPHEECSTPCLAAGCGLLWITSTPPPPVLPRRRVEPDC